MKPIIIRTKWLKRLTGIRGIMLYPFIVYSPYSSYDREVWGAADAYNDQVVRHETIHYLQAKEVGPVKFYFMYLKEYVENRLLGLNHPRAYRAIRFEMEAYMHQRNVGYEYSRPAFAWKESHFTWL